MFYGSQTGTAEEFANRLSKDAQRYGMKGMAADPEEYDMVISTTVCVCINIQTELKLTEVLHIFLDDAHYSNQWKICHSVLEKVSQQSLSSHNQIFQTWVYNHFYANIIHISRQNEPDNSDIYESKVISTDMQFKVFSTHCLWFWCIMF